MLRMFAFGFPLLILAVVTALFTLTALLPAPLFAKDSKVEDAPIVRPQMSGPVVHGLFVGKDGQPAQDLSGIACGPVTPGGALECLLVNDEGKAAQQVTIEGNRLMVGAIHVLIGSKPDGVVGQEPTVDCENGKGDFGEFDGEGVA